MRQQGWLCGSAVAMAMSVACGGSPPPPSTGNPPTDGGQQITGRERLGWNQPAASNAELATFRYAAYVDNTRSELNDVSCSPGGDTFACSSRMPTMAAGSHTIELVSFIIDGGTTVESARSAGLRVTVTGATADGASSGSASRPPNSPGSSSGSNSNTGAASRDFTTSDGVNLRADVLTEELESPTAIALASDGRMFVAERKGQIRIVSGGVVLSTSQPLDDVAPTGDAEGGLIGIALAPDFDRTRHVYALYTVLDREARPAFRVARFREAGGEFGERIALLDGVPASPAASGAMAIGPDGFLYLAFDDGGDAARAASPSSYNAKVLRLTLDGTTPVDQPASSPVYLSGHRSPRALDWQAASGSLWILDQRPGVAGELRGVRDGRSTRDSARTRISLSPRMGASSMTFYDSDLLPAFRGDLLVAASASRQLVRYRFDPRDVTRVAATEVLLNDTFTGVTAVSIGPEGAIYLATDRALVRLSPGSR